MKQRRAFLIEDPMQENENKNIVTFSVASSQPYLRYDKKDNPYLEVLEISEEAVNFFRMVDGRCPFIMEHDTNRQIGVVEKAYIKNEKLYVDVRFSENKFPQEVLRDILSRN